MITKKNENICDQMMLIHMYLYQLDTKLRNVSNIYLKLDMKIDYLTIPSLNNEFI